MKTAYLSIYRSNGSNDRLDVDKLDEGVVGLLDVDLEYLAELLEALVYLGKDHLPGDVPDVQGPRGLHVELSQLGIPRPKASKLNNMSYNCM